MEKASIILFSKWIENKFHLKQLIWFNILLIPISFIVFNYRFTPYPDKVFMFFLDVLVWVGFLLFSFFSLMIFYMLVKLIEEVRAPIDESFSFFEKFRDNSEYIKHKKNIILCICAFVWCFLNNGACISFVIGGQSAFSLLSSNGKQPIGSFHLIEFLFTYCIFFGITLLILLVINLIIRSLRITFIKKLK